MLFPLLFPWARSGQPWALELGELLLMSTPLVPAGQGGLSRSRAAGVPQAAFLLRCSLRRCRKDGQVCFALGRGEAAPIPGFILQRLSCPCF